MILRTWAEKWGISLEAILDLERLSGQAVSVATTGEKDGSESRQQSLIRLEAAGKGISLFRNNVGALLDARGVPVRYGLANESKEMNKRVKSADLIGVEPVLITDQMVGQTIGRFLSVEVKEENWAYSATPHEQAQAAWSRLIMAKGGRALFANRPGLL